MTTHLLGKDTLGARIRRAVVRIGLASRLSFVIQLAPAILLTIVALLAPLVFLFSVSLRQFDGLSPLKATPATAGNYVRYVEEPVFREALWRTLELTLATTAGCLLIAYPVAFALARYRIPLKKLVFFLLLTPLFVSAVVRSFGLMVLLDRNGLINSTLKELHLVSAPLQLSDSFFGAMIALMNSFLIFAIMPLYASILALPISYEEAAGTLGARRWRVWLTVILPLTLPGLIAAWILVFTLSVSSYAQPALLGGPDFLVLPTVLFQQFNSTLNWPFAAATGFILLVISLLAVIVPSWAIRRMLGRRIQVT